MTPFGIAMAGLFVGLVAAVQQALPFGRARNLWLLVASYLFYGFIDGPLCGVLIGSTLVDWWLSARIAPGRARRAMWLWSSVALNLGVLGYFKYRGFFIDTLSDVLGWVGAGPLGIQLAQIAMPAGLSFWTFQKLGYILDVYRGKTDRIADPVDFGLYVALFVQLIAGPIERAASLVPQIRGPRRLRAMDLRHGGWLILTGLFKKLVVADSLAPYVSQLFQMSSPQSGDAAAAALLFALLIYTDFAGYTDLARGAGRLLGFDLSRNFRAPYFSRNVQEFWTRWHITLSEWIKDYLYFPLLFTRPGRWLGMAGLPLFTMAVMGLWHGAAWNYVLWGAYHGVLLSLYTWVRPRLFRLRGAAAFFFSAPFGIAFTFTLGALGTLLFASPSIEQTGVLVRALCTEPGVSDLAREGVVLALWCYALPLAFDLAEERTGDHEAALRLHWLPLRLLQVIMITAVLFALTGESPPAPFLYFQF